MDRFGGARYPGYTMRRFYPAMVGANLTFAPSQYSGVDYAGTQREEGSWMDIVSGVVEAATGFGLEYVKGKYAESQEEKDIARERSQAVFDSKMADAEARRVALTQPTQAAEQTNYLPWVFGGLGLIAAITVSVIVLSKPRSRPSSDLRASSRSAPSGRKTSSRSASPSGRKTSSRSAASSSSRRK